MNSIDAATTLPSTPPGFVVRENVNMTIDVMLKGDADCVLIQGNDGVGKTTVLNSYVRSRPTDVICLFLRPVRASYEPSAALAELYSQLLTTLGAAGSHGDTPTVAALANLWQRLASRLRAENRAVAVVVDGLADVIHRDSTAAKEIMEFLPLGRPQFRLLLSGDIEELLRQFGVSWKAYPLTLFSIDETKQLFRHLDLSESDVTRAHTTCNGVVGQLAAVRRLVASGLGIKEIIDKQPGELMNTMLLEWDRLPALSAERPRLLATIAFDARRHTAQSLGTAVGEDVELVQRLVTAATFLQVTPEGVVEFVSETFKKFAQRRLQAHRAAILDGVIESLRGRSDVEAAETLPLMMAAASKYREHVQLLDQDYFSNLLHNSQSISMVESQADLGAKSAASADDDIGLYRLRLIQSIIGEVQRSDDRLQEVSALVAARRGHQALAIARSALFKEERLRLFASVLSQFVERGHGVDEGLRDELRQMCNAAPVAEMGNDLVEIASDVFAVDPSTAIQLVERFGRVTDKSHVFDWLLASLALKQAFPKSGEQTRGAMPSNIYERISDPVLRSMSHGWGLLGGTGDAEWILEQSVGIENSTDRLTVLRMWLLLNHRKSQAIRVAERAIELAIQTREYSLTLPVIRQFSAPLPYSDEPERVAALIGRIDALVAALPMKAPSVEYVRLQLLLARAQNPVGIGNAKLRTVELYLFIEGLTDLGDKAECLARLCEWMPVLEPERDHRDLRDELKTVVAELVLNSAYHDDVILPVLRPLLRHHADLAFEMVALINTDSRRDRVRAELIHHVARGQVGRANPATIVAELQAIDDPRIRTGAVLAALGAAADAGVTGQQLAERLFAFITDLLLPEERVTAYSLIARAMEGKPLGETARAKLQQAVLDVAPLHVRSQVGFDAVRQLAMVNTGAAEDLLAVLHRDSERTHRSSGAVVALSLSARLAYRALRGAIREGRESIEELEAALDLSDRIPDVVSRVTGLSELCFWLFEQRESDAAMTVYTDRLRRALQEAKSESIGRYWHCLMIAGWASFRRDERGFWRELEGVPRAVRDGIIANVIRTVLERVPPSEPAQFPATGRADIENKDCTDVIALLMETGDDSLVYWGIRGICRAASRRDTRLTREQIADLQRECGELVAKLPFANKIRHEGFKWACAGELLRLESAKETDWRFVIGEAEHIPNIPDSVYTMCLIASSMPNRFASFRRETVTRSIERARTIRVDSERLEALLNISEELWGIEPAVTREVLKECVAIAVGQDAPQEKQGVRVDRLLDIAYRISPEFALALSTDLDRDPVRDTARRQSLDARRTLEARQRMVSGERDPATLPSRSDVTALSTAAWRNLAALNGGILGPVSAAIARQTVDSAGPWPLGQVYPQFAWTVQNAVDRAGAKVSKGQHLRGLAQASVVAAQLVEVFAVGIGHRSTTEAVDDGSVGSGLRIIRAGERGRVQDALSEWCSIAKLSYLKIADQFFGPDELEFLRSVLLNSPKCKIQILTSLRHLQQLGLGDNAEQAFESAWVRVGPGEAELDVVVANVVGTGKSPLHDRWWIASESALDFGTSLNALGISQESAVWPRGAIEARAMEVSLDKYLNRQVRWTDAGQVRYVVFSF